MIELRTFTEWLREVETRFIFNDPLNLPSDFVDISKCGWFIPKNSTFFKQMDTDIETFQANMKKMTERYKNLKPNPPLLRTQEGNWIFPNV